MGERGRRDLWNYLRVRGEYNRRSRRRIKSSELPPRARRILIASMINEVNFGTTSACAENTPFCLATSTIMWNYLRVRGEYRHQSGCVRCVVELPPRARRIQETGRPPRRSIGTTSACAENTIRSGQRNAYRRNYLRVRGEYVITVTPDNSSVELPPRARRIPDWVATIEVWEGTTSACAENTQRESMCLNHLWNYLRVRGEYEIRQSLGT